MKSIHENFIMCAIKRILLTRQNQKQYARTCSHISGFIGLKGYRTETVQEYRPGNSDGRMFSMVHKYLTSNDVPPNAIQDISADNTKDSTENIPSINYFDVPIHVNCIIKPLEYICPGGLSRLLLLVR